jgi:hypothetical protein
MDHTPLEIVPRGKIVGTEVTGDELSVDGRHELLMQTFSEAQVDFLLQRTPRSEIKVRPGRGGLQFSYVEHGYVTERLNLVFGFNWDFEVVDKQMLEDEVIVEARLTVRTPGGQTIVKTQFGGAEIKRHNSGAKNGRPLSIADDYKAAASDALKKCASLLGIGLDLYGRDRVDDEESEGSKPTNKNQVPARLGANAPGMATASQIARIVEAASGQGMSQSKLCARLNITDLSQLTEAKAERVLKRLLEMPRLTEDQQVS